MNILRLADFPSKSVLENHSHEIDVYGLGITHILPLSRELMMAKHRVGVLAGGGLRYPQHEIVGGIDVYRTRLPMKPYYLSLGPALLFNIRKIESERGDVDVVHAHNPPLTYGYSFVKRLVKIPFVATIHGTFCYDLLEKSVFLKKMVSQVDHFIAINEPSVDILRRIGVGEDKISLVHTGVDTRVFRKVGDAEKIVLYAGRLVGWKNVGVVLDMAGMMKRSHPEVKFYIVGRGECEAELKEKVASRGLSNVFFFDSVPPERMPVVYSKASVFVAPHEFDSFGKTVLEALACETPVVATGFDVPEDVKQCGVFVSDAGDVAGMVEALVRIIEDDDLRKKFGRRGRRVVERSYTWKKCADRSVDVYRKVL